MTTTRTLNAGPALSLNAWLRFDLLRQRLAALAPGRALEIGPGRGAIAARLVRAGHDYTGVELSDASRAATDELLGGIPGHPPYRLVSSMGALDADDRFDLVCAFEVLEHIEEDAAALQEWVGRLSPGGTLLLSVPAWEERFSSQDVAVGHIRRYDPDQLEALVVGAGLEQVDVVLYGFPLGFALEQARIILLERRRAGAVEEESVIDRTKRSGALLQPPRWSNAAVRAGTWPFRVVQRRVPDRGTGLVVAARAPRG